MKAAIMKAAIMKAAIMKAAIMKAAIMKAAIMKAAIMKAAMWRQVGAGGGAAALALMAAAGFALSPGARQGALQMAGSVCFTDSGPMFASSAADKAAGRPVTMTTVLSCSRLASVPGKSVTTAMVDYPPLAYTPPHRHPGEVTAVVMEGTIRSQVNGGGVGDFVAGQTWFEEPKALHNFAENPDPKKPAKLLAFFVTEENCGALVIPEK
ncbi:MAG: Cupin 2 conserved barrel domain protein [Betaproteobacteria bacterium]|nr:Cupin 2 conserved barrel domain protein [Betaproteobacteria bacterium]